MIARTLVCCLVTVAPALAESSAIDSLRPPAILSLPAVLEVPDAPASPSSTIEDLMARRKPEAAPAGEPSFTRSDGRSVSRRQAFGAGYVLLVLVAPWDGVTKDTLDRLERYRTAFRGRVRPLVMLEQTSRAVANRFMERSRYKGPWLLDEAGRLLTEFTPATLPFTVLMAPNGEVLLRSAYVSDEVLRLLTTNPGRFLRERARRLQRGLPIVTNDPDTGPWGPPEPKDPYLVDGAAP